MRGLLFTVPRRGWWGGAALLGAAGVFWLASSGAIEPARVTDALSTPLAQGAGGVAAAQAPLSAASAALLASVTPFPASAASGPRGPTPKISVEALRKLGSLRGTELDGNWGQFSSGELQPGKRLRQRFDHLLVGLGEVDEANLRAWIAQQVKSAHGDKGAEQVLAIWDAYIALQRAQVGGKAVDPADAQAWQRWLAERSAARARVLGPAWAEAFFAEEHRDLQDFGERMVQRAAAPPGALEPESAAQKVLLPSATVLDPKALAQRQVERVKYFGEEAAQRLAAEDKAWAEWAQRIEAARQRREQIAGDKQLSDAQRKQALEADLASHFQGIELVRAKGLVGR